MAFGEGKPGENDGIVYTIHEGQLLIEQCGSRAFSFSKDVKLEYRRERRNRLGKEAKLRE